MHPQIHFLRLRALGCWLALAVLAGCTATGSGGDRSAMADKAACAALVHDYAILRDRLDARAVADLFTKDAQLSVLGETFNGRDAIYQRIINTPTSPMSRHLMHSVKITLESDDRASGISYVTVYMAPTAQGLPAEVSGFAAMGEYQDEYQRTDQGWQIRSRKFVRNLVQTTGELGP